MDQIRSQKLQAIENYKKSQFFHSLVFHSLVAITCSLVVSYPFWFSTLASSMNYFVKIYLPNIWCSFLSPKCLFIVFNVIVAFLVGESKLLGSQSSSPAVDIYSEYIERERSLRESQKYNSITTTLQDEKKEEMNMVEDKEVVFEVKEELEEEEEFKEVENNNEEKEKEEEEEEEEESVGLPAEELNKRAEAFIARVNNQRWLEARMAICGKA
ncbi:hypothetical protein UlMin_040058 [Ulmus minor]